MTVPIERLLDTVEWEELPPPDGTEGDLPYATHEGVLHIGEIELRCCQLNTGQRVFDAESIATFFGALEAEESSS